MGTVYDALLNHRAVNGAEAELQQHLGLAGNQIPLDLLRGAGRDGNGGMEYRAVTPGAANVGQNEMPVINYVFRSLRRPSWAWICPLSALVKWSTGFDRDPER